MIPVQILSRYDVTLKAQLGEKMHSHCISITDPGEPMAEELVRVHPIPLPNRRMTRLCDGVLGTDLTAEAEKLWARARDFLDDKIEIDPDDYLEELQPSE